MLGVGVGVGVDIDGSFLWYWMWSKFPSLDSILSINSLESMEGSGNPANELSIVWDKVWVESVINSTNDGFLLFRIVFVNTEMIIHGVSWIGFGYDF